VVYFPACVSRTMGAAAGDPLVDPLHVVTERVLRRAGYRVIYPEQMEDLVLRPALRKQGFFRPSQA
jgi:D-lactate dehydrogenase